MKTLRSCVTIGGVVILVALSSGSAYAQLQAWTVDSWDPSFDFGNTPKSVEYKPLERATKKWHLCVSFPHLKDPYWMATDYGVVDQAKKEGVAVTLVEAGGYPRGCYGP